MEGGNAHTATRSHTPTATLTVKRPDDPSVPCSTSKEVRALTGQAAVAGGFDGELTPQRNKKPWSKKAWRASHTDAADSSYLTNVKQRRASAEARLGGNPDDLVAYAFACYMVSCDPEVLRRRIESANLKPYRFGWAVFGDVLLGHLQAVQTAANRDAHDTDTEA